MIQIQNTLVSEDILEKEFVCNLSKCKGACCIEGDSGAPLEEEEKAILDEVFDVVKPYMTEKGIAAVEAQGKYVIDSQNDLTTPLINDRECAYTIWDDHGMAKCGIEQAHIDGKIDWKKPVSCHLYPVRTTKYSMFEAVNYNKWDICSDACALGAELQVPVYKFLKDALTRKYGEDWYKELELVAGEYQKQFGKR